jgi:hypothetical protein
MAMAGGPTQRKAKQLGWQIQVAWGDLGALEKWLPSLRGLIDAFDQAGL